MPWGGELPNALPIRDKCGGVSAEHITYHARDNADRNGGGGGGRGHDRTADNTPRTMQPISSTDQVRRLFLYPAKTKFRAMWPTAANTTQNARSAAV